MNETRSEKPFDVLKGKTFKQVFKTDNELFFVTEDKQAWRFTHFQDCCEDVHIESVVGDLKDLIDTPLLFVEEAVIESNIGDYFDTCTSTFYKFATKKGWVDVRWVGESNGYYSESVDFTETPYLEIPDEPSLMNTKV